MGAYLDQDPALLYYSIECEFENPDPYQERLNTEDRNAPRIKKMYNVWHVLRKCIIISRNKKTVMMARYVCYVHFIVQYMFMCVYIPGTIEITRVLCNVRKSYVNM
jgi:hypothetical protein